MSYPGQEVTNLVWAFHQAIRDLYPHFVRVGLTASSDEWQKACEDLLSMLVIAPARGISADDDLLRGSYALWDPMGAAASPLLVIPNPDAPLFASGPIPSTRDPGVIIQFRDARGSDVDAPVQFREFANPLVDEEDVAVLDHAAGYVNSRTGLLRVVVPVRQAEFYLAES